jgi:hypothetical protein
MCGVRTATCRGRGLAFHEAAYVNCSVMKINALEFVASAIFFSQLPL